MSTIVRGTTAQITWELPKNYPVGEFNACSFIVEGANYSVERTKDEQQLIIDTDTNTITLTMEYYETSQFSADEIIEAQIYFEINGQRKVTNIWKERIGKILSFKKMSIEQDVNGVN